MNRNKKSAKQYHQSVITALEKKVNELEKQLEDKHAESL